MMAAPNWRSLLFVPATAEKFVARAHTRGADVIILDLEDSIPPNAKEEARAALPAAARQVRAGGPEVCVRINRPLELAVPDILAAVLPEVSALMLPKAMGPEHVRLLAELVSAREAALGLSPGQVRLIPVVETAESLPLLPEIARASPRVAAIGVGAEDLCTELEAEPGADALYVFGMQVVAAARAAGVLPMGSIGPFADFSDLEAYRASLRRSRRLGFGCAACIHPSQVAPINEEYGPSPAEVDRARRMIGAFEAALAEGRGAVAFDGQMIDLPVVDRARKVLARAR
jgi:citrate lyase subunit beta / citryl-CoA lyase